MFKGHQLVKLINDNWVFDFTDYTGYNVKVDKDGNIVNCKEAFQAIVEGESINFEKNCRVPVKVLKEAANQILKYQVSMEVKDEQYRI